MRKLWMVLSVTLILSLVWGVIPAFGGWSWCGADPVFLIEGEEGDEVTVNVDVVVAFAGDPDQFDPKKVRVVLQVPDDTDVEVLDDGGFKVKVKDDDDGDQAKLTVVVKKQWRDEYRLEQITVACDDGREIEPQTQENDKWVFQFDLW